MTLSFWLGLQQWRCGQHIEVGVELSDVLSNTNSELKEQPRYLILSFCLTPTISLPSLNHSESSINLPSLMMIAWLLAALMFNPIFSNKFFTNSIVRIALVLDSEVTA